MSKRAGERPHGDEVDTTLGELRKPGDRIDQPGQGAELAPPNPGHANPRNDQPVREELDPARLQVDPPRP